MIVLVTGGSKCGRSRYAESLFERFEQKKYYIATMRPYGGDSLEAIARHRELRAGKGFETIEKYTDLEQISPENGCGILLECMSNLIANEMFTQDGVNDPTEKIMRGIEALAERAGLLVIVSSDVGGDGIKYDGSTMEYIRVMGKINALIAAKADSVTECIYGLPFALKGSVK